MKKFRFQRIKLAIQVPHDGGEFIMSIDEVEAFLKEAKQEGATHLNICDDLDEYGNPVLLDVEAFAWEEETDEAFAKRKAELDEIRRKKEQEQLEAKLAERERLYQTYLKLKNKFENEA